MVKSVKTRRILTTVFLIALLAAGILFFPVPAAATNDRTQAFNAVTYKIVIWNKTLPNGETYKKTRFYFLSQRYKSLDELWAQEEESLFGKTLENTSTDFSAK